jgi:hypothetical protein
MVALNIKGTSFYFELGSCGNAFTATALTFSPRLGSYHPHVLSTKPAIVGEYGFFSFAHNRSGKVMVIAETDSEGK